MTKERIEKELLKVREQLAGLQARQKDLEEQLQMAEDAEKMKFIEKNKISLERLMLMNKVSEEEILHLLKKKEHSLHNSRSWQIPNRAYRIKLLIKQAITPP